MTEDGPRDQVAWDMPQVDAKTPTVVLPNSRPWTVQRPNILLRLPHCRYVAQFPESVHVRIGMESTTLLCNNALLCFERTPPMLASPWKPGRSILHRRVKDHRK
jgi:hypothetical protein